MPALKTMWPGLKIMWLSRIKSFWDQSTTYLHMYFTVIGDANFDIESTKFTLGRSTQTAVARSLIENTANIKGLSQRFIWIFPKPVYLDFETFQSIDPHLQKH